MSCWRGREAPPLICGRQWRFAPFCGMLVPCGVLILVLCHVLTPCRVSLLHSMSCLDYENLNCQVELFLVSMYKKNSNILYRKKANRLSKV